MLNQIVLVGRITREIEVLEESGKKRSIISIAIPRSFKNAEGGYDTDFIDAVMFDNIATNVKEYCQKGDIVGIKGRVQSRTIPKDDKTEYVMEIIAEKVTFLSSRKEETEEGENE